MTSKSKKLLALAGAASLMSLGSSLSIALCHGIVTANPFEPSAIVPVAYATLLLGLIGSALTGWLAYACCLMYMTLSVVMVRRNRNQRRREASVHRALACESDLIIESMLSDIDQFRSGRNSTALR